MAKTGIDVKGKGSKDAVDLGKGPQGIIKTLPKTASEAASIIKREAAKEAQAHIGRFNIALVVNHVIGQKLYPSGIEKKGEYLDALSKSYGLHPNNLRKYMKLAKIEAVLINADKLTLSHVTILDRMAPDELDNKRVTEVVKTVQTIGYQSTVEHYFPQADRPKKAKPAIQATDLKEFKATAYSLDEAKTLMQAMGRAIKALEKRITQIEKGLEDQIKKAA